MKERLKNTKSETLSIPRSRVDRCHDERRVSDEDSGGEEDNMKP